MATSLHESPIRRGRGFLGHTAIWHYSYRLFLIAYPKILAARLCLGLEASGWLTKISKKQPIGSGMLLWA